MDINKQININLIIHYTIHILCITDSYSMDDIRMFHQTAHFSNPAKTIGNQCVDKRDQSIATYVTFSFGNSCAV